MRIFLAILLLVVLLVVARLSLFTVDAAEFVYVTLLGRPIEVLDGGDSQEAGLHVGWPWPVQSALRLDRRLQFFDLPAAELLTHDPRGNTIDKTLTVEAFVCWRIAGKENVELFVQKIGTPANAQSILGPRIKSQLGAAIGAMRMDDLISTAPGSKPGQTKVDETMDAIKASLMSSLSDVARKDYGIELVDVRLRRFNHPDQVRDSIFDRIRSERNKIAAEYRSEGNKQAAQIASDAEKTKRELLARARSEEERLKGEADTQAAWIRNKAHSQDPEFYAFLKKMEKLQSILGDNKTVLLLSSNRPLFDLLFQPPQPGRVVRTEPKDGPSVPVAAPNPKQVER